MTLPGHDPLWISILHGVHRDNGQSTAILPKKEARPLGKPDLKTQAAKARRSHVGAGLWSFAWGHDLIGRDAQSLLIVPKAPREDV